MSRKMIKMIIAPAHIITTARHRSEGLHKALLTFWQKCSLSFAHTYLTIFSQPLRQPPLRGLSPVVKGKTSRAKFNRKQGFLCSVRMLTKLLWGHQWSHYSVVFMKNIGLWLMWLTWWLEARSHYRLGLSKVQILELYAGGTTGPSSDSW